MHRYNYVGPTEIGKRTFASERHLVTCPEDVRNGISNNRTAVAGGSMMATFVIDTTSLRGLQTSQRTCRVCTWRRRAFSWRDDIVHGLDERWQFRGYHKSTGYCPGIDSWPVVAVALDKARIGHPNGFTVKCVFRKCSCGQINIIKDNYFQCAVCGSQLPEHVP